jgi:hypothetical protein
VSHERAPQPFTLSEPLDFEDARQAGKELARQRKEAREEFERRLEQAAEKQRLKRLALAKAFVEATGDTAAAREADAKKRAADAEYEHALAEGLVKAAQQRMEELDAHRATFHRLVEWSMRLDPFAQEQRETPRRAA